MSLTEIFSHFSRSKTAKQGETMNYSDVFETDTGSTVSISGRNEAYLPGMRLVENDVDAYFKDVFAGPVF